MDPAQARHGDEIIPHHLFPDLLDLLDFGKEAVPPNIEAVPIMTFCTRNTADDFARLKHEGRDSRYFSLKFISAG